MVSHKISEAEKMFVSVDVFPVVRMWIVFSGYSGFNLGVNLQFPIRELISPDEITFGDCVNEVF